MRFITQQGKMHGPEELSATLKDAQQPIRKLPKH